MFNIQRRTGERTTWNAERRAPTELASEGRPAVHSWRTPHVEETPMADTPKQDRALGLPRERIGGRFVTAYAPELGLLICEQIAEGQTLKSICEAKDMPHRQTFHRWVVIHPELARAYSAARVLSAHALEEEALDMARTIRDMELKAGDSSKVRAYDIAMSQFRWSAAKRDPRVFSERASVKFTVPIQINTTIDMGGGPNDSNATAEHPNIYDIEAKVVEEPAPGEAAPTNEERMKDGDVPLIGAKRNRKRSGAGRKK